MLPSAQDLTQPEGGDLEQRLRSLILSNGSANQGTDDIVSTSPALPPHMLTATAAEQQAYLTTRNSRTGSQPSSKAPDQTSQPTKKRLNQAQRRQMNSHLSIPIDPRPTPATQSGYSPNLYSGGGQQSRVSPQYGYQQQQYNQRYQQQQQSYSPRFPNQGQGSPFSPRGSYPHGPPQSPYQHNLNPPSQQHQGTNLYHQQPSPGIRSPESPFGRAPPQNRPLYQPSSYNGQSRGRPFGHSPEDMSVQSSYLMKLLMEIVPTIGIDAEEEGEKDAFRALVESACRESIAQYEQEELGNPEFDASTVELKCFGSMSSGFATKASDMDLALVTPLSSPAADSSESPIPRLLERKLLDMGYGARLLTRTRVPIIKLCEKPTDKLLSDLREERAKWEKGFVEGHEEDDVGVLQSQISEENKSIKNTNFSSPVPKTTELAPAKASSNEDQLGKLKQKENQSLGDYYIVAKRLLRKVGGRDLTPASPDLTEEEGKILNGICKAFISGLKSEDLVARLCSYKSISHLFDASLPILQRTLSGVWTQIEGERLAMAFEDRPLTEFHDQREYECLALVKNWRLLQDKCGPVIESLIYNRQLFVEVEKLKNISSLQLVFLEQAEHEEPVYYHRRAQKIMDDLSGRGQQNLSLVTPIVITHYITGIHSPQIRASLQKLTGIEASAEGDDLPQKTQQHPQNSLNLNQVGLQHQALQLATDYDHALKKGIFDKTDQASVEQYVVLLRSRTLEGFTANSHEDLALIERMRTLPDPTTISTNRPRDRYRDPLEFPKADIGIQCDINFSADLALHNTLLLRCYSHSDPRVKLLILFIKHWAKVRSINTPYRGTLSSYGYVLMVLHYLVNVAQPFVCPNLQLLHKEPPAYLPPAEIEARTKCNGRDVRFWRNETEIKDLAARGLLNHNKDTVGFLLRGFFEYFAHGGQMSTVQNSRGFDWGREVLSLRTYGGILTKQEKGWVGAKTITETTTITAPPTPSTPAYPKETPEEDAVPVSEAEMEAKPKSKTMEETKEIRHRYLFAIEDPFELDHNIARTVTHNGIVSIRDEFRRAWRIIKDIGKGNSAEGLLDPVANDEAKSSSLQDLIDLIHDVKPNFK